MKQALKRALFSAELHPLTVRRGPGRGVVFLGTRRADCRRELGVWESELNRFYRRHIRPGSCVWDVGADDGYTALIYANLGASVHAFEPSPAGCRRMRANLELNPRLAPRIVLHQLAVDEQADLDSIPAPDLVKVDVDLAEPVVREALAPLLARTGPVVIWETHGAENEAASAASLDRLGYEVRLVRNAAWKGLSPEHRPDMGGINRWLVAAPRRGPA